MSRPSAPPSETEHQRLGQKLPDDAVARGAERRPDRHLALARGAPREQQIGDVGARNQQDERDRSAEDQQRRPQIAGELFTDRQHARRPPRVERRELGREGGHDRRHLRLRLRHARHRA